MKVFLGGTVNNSTWRNNVMKELEMDYYNPIVDNWNEEAYQREWNERKTCEYLLYIITPKMTGFYAVAEVADDSYHRPERTLFCFLPEDDGQKFSEEQLEQMKALGELVEKNGGRWFTDLAEVISFLNSIKLNDIRS